MQTTSLGPGQKVITSAQPSAQFAQFAQCAPMSKCYSVSPEIAMPTAHDKPSRRHHAPCEAVSVWP